MKTSTELLAEIVTVLRQVPKQSFHRIWLIAWIHGGPTVSIMEQPDSKSRKVYGRLPEIPISVKLSELLEKLDATKRAEGEEWTTLFLTLYSDGRLETEFGLRRSAFHLVTDDWEKKYLIGLERVPFKFGD